MSYIIVSDVTQSSTCIGLNKSYECLLTLLGKTKLYIEKVNVRSYDVNLLAASSSNPMDISSSRTLSRYLKHTETFPFLSKSAFAL